MAFFPLFDFKLINIGIVAFALGSALKFYENDTFSRRPWKKVVLETLILSAPFLLSLIALLWTQNINVGITFVERSLPFILFPVVFLLWKPLNSSTQVKTFFQIYIVSNLVLALAFILISIISLLHLSKDVSLPTTLLIKKFRGGFESVLVIGEHPIYLALMLGTALLFLFFFKFKKLWKNLISAFLLFIALLMSGSIGPMIALLAVVILIIFLKPLKVKTKLTMAVAFLFLVFGAFTLSPYKKRINEFLNTTQIYPKGDYFNSFNIRMGIYKCALNIAKNVPIYGLGAGDVQTELDLCYKNEFNTKAYDAGIFNTHNQYFFFWLSYGILGICLVLFSYYFYLRTAILNHNKAYLAFLSFMLVCFLFENILSRNTGIMVFSLFNTIFFYRKLNGQMSQE